MNKKVIGQNLTPILNEKNEWTLADFLDYVYRTSEFTGIRSIEHKQYKIFLKNLTKQSQYNKCAEDAL